MTRLFLIFVMLIQLSGCASIFWQTIGGTLIGNVAAEVIKDKIDENAKDEAPQP